MNFSNVSCFCESYRICEIWSSFCSHYTHQWHHYNFYVLLNYSNSFLYVLLFTIQFVAWLTQEDYFLLIEVFMPHLFLFCQESLSDCDLDLAFWVLYPRNCFQWCRPHHRKAIETGVKVENLCKICFARQLISCKTGR